jgi:simple sugar transport system permease protein
MDYKTANETDPRGDAQGFGQATERMDYDTLYKKILRLFSESSIAGPLATLILVFVLCLIFVPNFATWRTVSGIVTAMSISGFVTIGITILMISGEFDLSVAPMIAMSGYLYGTISTGEDSVIVSTLSFLGLPVQGGSIPLAIIFALLVPAMMGLINGLILIATNIPSFIVTLGTQQIYRGLVWIVAGGVLFQTIQDLPVYDLFNGRFDLLNNWLEKANFRTTMLWLLGTAIIFQLILVRTRFGNHIFAAGGSRDAALAQGVRVWRTKTMAFVISGLMAGAGGIVSFSQFKSVRVAEQAGIELTAIAASVIGGTLLTGGYGSIWGALIGILIINILRSGVILLKIPFISADNFPAVVGVTIIGAVIINNYLRSRSTS